jgi:predicted ABC-type exoprotein transport system permease subunit
MYQENELITFIIVLGILVFLLANRKRIDILMDRYLLLSFFFYIAASVFTVVESFLLPSLLNILEHVSILLHSVFFTVWIWRIIKQKTGFKA